MYEELFMSINYTRGGEIPAIPGALLWGGTKHAGHANWSMTLSPSVIPLSYDKNMNTIPIPGPLTNKNVEVPLAFTETLTPNVRDNNIRYALKASEFYNPLKRQQAMMSVLSNQMYSTPLNGDHIPSDRGVISNKASPPEYQSKPEPLIDFMEVKRQEYLRAIQTAAFNAEMEYSSEQPSVAIFAPMSENAVVYSQFPPNSGEKSLLNFYNTRRPNSVGQRLAGV